jgi:hypothetical protein
MAFDDATRLDTKYALAWNYTGIVLDEQGKYDEAIKCYEVHQPVK